MYKEFFGFKKRPFVLTPDPKFLFLSKVHDLALTHLEYGIINNAGFIVITGEVGSGKTTLIKYLFERIKNDLDIAMLFNTNLDPHTLLEMLVKEFEIETKSYRKSDLFEALANHFIAQYSKGKRCVIIVDEAQNLSLESFEELRMLSNIEVDTNFILQIILVGQPELKLKLSLPSLSQLVQRVSVFFHISPLSSGEVKDYINHRLKVAGYNKEVPLFEEEAVDYIAEVSKGIPRIINLICDTALVYAFADDLNVITVDIVEKVVQDNDFLLSLKKVEDKKDSETYKKIQKDEKEEVIISEIKDIFLNLARKVEALDMRLKSIESYDKDKASKVLYEMLVKERDKNINLEKKIVTLELKIKELEEEIEALRKKREKHKKNKKLWEVFSLGKKKY